MIPCFQATSGSHISAFFVKYSTTRSWKAANLTRYDLLKTFLLLFLLNYKALSRQYAWLSGDFYVHKTSSAAHCFIAIRNTLHFTKTLFQ